MNKPFIFILLTGAIMCIAGFLKLFKGPEEKHVTVEDSDDYYDIDIAREFDR